MKMTIETKKQIEQERGNKEMENKITFLNSVETLYEDNSYWVEYLIGTGDNYSIALIQGEEDEEEDNETLKEKLMELGTEKLTNKILLEDCSEKLQEIMGYCLSSENDTWFVEDDEITKKELEVLEEEIYKLGLDDCMVIHEDELTPVTIYGDAITRFIFN